VVNDTADRLRFTKVRGSCACSKAKLNKMELMPGEQSLLYVEVDMTRYGGQRHVNCLLETDEGEPWKYILNLTAYPFFQCAKNNLEHVSFGEIDPGHKAEKSVEVYLHAAGQDTVPPVLVSAECEADDIQVTTANGEDWEALADGSGTRRKATVHFSLRPQSRAGARTTTSRVRYRSGDVEGDARFTVSWQVRPVYDVSPSRVYLDAFRAGAGPLQQSVEIRRLDRQPLEIRAVDPGSPAVSIKRIEAVVADRQRIVFEISPDAVPDVLVADVVVKTNHPLQPIISIVISGRRIADALPAIPADGPKVIPGVRQN
jgi:hypothetical protein